MTSTASGHEASLVDRLVTAVEGVDGVARLSGGGFGMLATFDGPRRVKGIALDSSDASSTDPVGVGIVITRGEPIAQVAEAVREAVRRELRTEGLSRSVDVYVTDVAEAPETTDDAAAPAVSPESTSAGMLTADQPASPSVAASEVASQ